MRIHFLGMSGKKILSVFGFYFPSNCAMATWYVKLTYRVLYWLLFNKFIIIIIIIMTHRAISRIRPSRFLTNTLCSVPPLWQLPSSSTPPCFFPSPSCLWPPSRSSTFWCPPQCYKAVVCTLSPEYVSQPVSPSLSYLAAYFIVNKFILVIFSSMLTLLTIKGSMSKVLNVVLFTDR